MAKRTFGYCRVSGNETDSRSRDAKKEQAERLADQEAKIRKYCQEQKLPEPTIFAEIESGGSKTGEHRDKQVELLSKLKAGDLVIVNKLDRWSRDVVFDRNSYDRIVAANANWYSIQEPFLAGNDPQTIYIRTNFSNFAEYERAIIKIRTVGKRKELRATGAYVEGLPPLGYKRAPRIGKNLEDRFLHKSEDAPIVVEIYERCASGQAVAAILAWLRKAYPHKRGWNPHSVADVLHSRVYLGEVEKVVGSGEYIAAHEPIVSRALFAKVQAGLTSRKIGGKGKKSNDVTSRTYTWLLRGLANCSVCNARIGGRYGKAQAGKEYNYYGCNTRMAASKTGRECASEFLPVPGVDATALVQMENRLKSVHEWIKPPKVRTAPKVDFEGLRKKLATKRSRILGQWADGEITDRDDYKARLAKVDAELRNLEVQEPEAPQARASLIGTLEGLARMLPGMSVPERREALSYLASYVVLAPDGSVAVTWRPAEELIQRRPPR